MTALGTAKLLEIATRAVTLHAFEAEVKRHKGFLNQAYQEWRDENGCEHAAKYSPEWDRMLEATRDTYLALNACKRAAYNAKRRLDGAIQRFGRPA